MESNIESLMHGFGIAITVQHILLMTIGVLLMMDVLECTNECHALPRTATHCPSQPRPAAPDSDSFG